VRIASLPQFGVCFFLPSLLSALLSFLFPSARLQVAPADESSPLYACTKDMPFVVRIFNFHIFGYFSPKIVEIKPEIANFKPKC